MKNTLSPAMANPRGLPSWNPRVRAFWRGNVSVLDMDSIVPHPGRHGSVGG
jgi:hypothetical protein